MKSDEIYKRHAFDFANAVASAQALLKDGDYFKLFAFEGDFFMAPLCSSPHEDPPLPDDVGLSPEQMRKKAVGKMQAVFAELIAFATTAYAALPARAVQEGQGCGRAQGRPD